ncbi:MAG: MFS transporter [Promethearchaeia archaeon]
MDKESKTSSLLSIILFITIVALIYSTQNMISPNLLLISEYFGFGGATSQLGVLTFTFTLLSGMAMIIFGYLADKVVRKWIVFGGTLVYSFFSLMTIFVPGGVMGYYWFFFLTCMNGVGYGAIIPSVFSLIGDLVSQDNRSKGYSFFSIASLIGMALGMGLATLAGQFDWRVSFFVVGIAGLVNSLFILSFEEPSRIGKDFEEMVDKEAVEYSYRIKREDLKYVFKKKSNIFLIINFVDTIPTGIILFLLYAYMEDFHNIPSDLTLIFLGFILLSTLLGTVIFGIIGDRLFQEGYKKARVYLALMANIVPIPFVFIALLIPFEAPVGASLWTLFTIPGAVLMLVLISMGLFINGATNGSWYATVVDINLPEHRATVLATANFFDIIGRAIGPLIGTLIADAYGLLSGMMISIVFWIFLPFFWIPVLRNVKQEMERTNELLKARIKELKGEKSR